MPDTPEYKKYRRLWWYSLGISVVLLALSLLLGVRSIRDSLGLSFEAAQTPIMILSWVALAFVAFSWWLDFKKIRPLVKQGGKSPSGRAEKAEKKSKAKESEEKKAESERGNKADKETDRKDDKEDREGNKRSDIKDGKKDSENDGEDE
jgi:flagellar biosynthesis/type III secretory pathway M-ring protein FliF/YscJ